MAKTKIAILGAAGMLGTDLTAACRKYGIDASVFDLPEFDITKNSDIADAVKDVTAVVNCAAYTNVEKAETESELAYRVNAEAVGKLAAFAKKAGIWVMHISTDFVFDGKSSTPYIETDTVNPVNVYGKSKFAGEQLLIESGCNHCILRLQWSYGLAGNNFIAKLISLVKQKRVLRVVDDQVGSPTATTETAEVICRLLQNRPKGLFHFAAEGYVSRFEMAKFIFDKLDTSVSLSSCSSSDFATAAERPLNSRFDCSKIKPLLDGQIKPWQVPLENFLRKL